MFKRTLAIALTLFFLLSTVSSGQSNGKKVYLVVANRLLISDIEHMDNFKEIIDESGIGLMNIRGAASYNDIEGFLTINSSSKTYGVQNMAQMYNLDKETKDLYETRMGPLDGEYEVGNIEFNRIKIFNEEKDHDPVLGALGENLKAAGIKRAVYGNSDDEEPLRLGSLIAMDKKGLVEYGDVENTNMKDSSSPYGIRMDYDKVIENIESLKEEVSFTVVDIGDLDRLSSYGMYLDDEMFDFHRKRTLSYLDDFLLKLKERAEPDSMIIVLSPNEGEMRYSENKLSPIAIWTKDASPSLLKSGSTRIDGLVTNMDIAPTISEYLKAPAENYVGRDIEFMTSDIDRLEYLEKMSTHNNFLLRARSSLLYYYAAFTMASLVTLGLVAAFAKSLPESTKRAVQQMVAFTAALPLSFMLVSVFRFESEPILLIVSLVIALALAFAANRVSKDNSVIVVFAATALLILIDTFTGSEMTRNSIMGYSPVMGARYFGIGNELAGLFLSSIAILSGYIAFKFNKRLLWILPFLGTIVMVMPNLGANVGGSISFAAMAITVAILNSKVKMSWKALVLVGVLAFLGIIAVGILDYRFSDNPTHLGRLIMNVKDEGLESFFTVATRKLSVNIRLMGVSIWSRVLIVTTALISLLAASLKGTFRELFAREKTLAYSLIAVFIASAVGLLVNDSGVLLAAFANIYTSSFLIQTSINKKEKAS